MKLAEKALEVARRDRELTKIIDLFYASGEGDDVAFMARLVDAANMLKAAADSRQIAQLDVGQVASAFSAARSAYSTLRRTDGRVLTETQLIAGMRGVGGLIDRWAGSEETRFQKGDYDVEVDGLADYFVQTLQNVLLLGRLFAGRVSLPDGEAMTSRQRGNMAVAIITLPANPFNKAV